MQEVGYVTSKRSYIVYLDGLPSIRIHDLVENEQGIRGMVNALHDDQVEVVILDEGQVHPGQLFKKSTQQLALHPGTFLLGRAINPLGVPIDGKGLLPRLDEENNMIGIDQAARGIKSREFIRNQFITGVTLIDALIPIGKGQRELILCDPYSGKTDFLVSLMVNQKRTGVICIYALIGKPIIQVRSLIDTLKANQATEHSVIVASSSSDPAPLIFLTPHTAFTVAEYFQSLGKDVLIILDDMGNHAKIYREMSLLGDKSPGKESYPGDMFYQHSRLLERAGNFNRDYGGGSITALPVIEINMNDFATLIPTNIMSMTDGHLMFKSSLHNQGQIPAIDIPFSVSRVGRQTQRRTMNILSTQIRQVLAEAESLETVSRFSSELPYQTQLTLRQKELIEEIIRQEPLTNVPEEIQIILLGLVFTNFLKYKNGNYIHKNKTAMIHELMSNPQLTAFIQNATKVQTETELFQLLEGLHPILKGIFPE